MDLADLTFVLSDARIPVWWTQHPSDLPVLTGWFGGPKTARMVDLDERELVEAGLASLAVIFGLDPKQLMRGLVASRAINWAKDRFARGAYSYATTETRAAQSVLSTSTGGAVFFSGEALYRGRDMGTWRRRWPAAWRPRGRSFAHRYPDPPAVKQVKAQSTRNPWSARPSAVLEDRFHVPLR